MNDYVYNFTLDYLRSPVTINKLKAKVVYKCIVCKLCVIYIFHKTENGK